MNTRFDTVVVGGGQSGLATGYFLARQRQSFLILDRHPKIGDAWRTRWDSLRIFTPAKYAGLPGMRFPAPRLSFPTKDEVGDYLAAYAQRFDLPVRTVVSVEHMSRVADRFVLSTSAGTFEADNVVVATGAAQAPKVPAFASELSRNIVQMHSGAYKNPSQLRDGPVLVVGLGNSGAEISYDLHRTHRVFLSGTPAGEIPSPDSAIAAAFVLPILMFLARHVLTLDTPIGRRVLPQLHGQAAPLARTHVKDLEAAGIERVARVTGVSNGMALLADGRTLEVANLIWCTGFRADFSWIEIPEAFGPSGEPVQERGVFTAAPGLYCVGQEFQYSFASDILPGIGRDAAYVVRQIARRAGLRRVDSEDTVLRRDAAELGVG